MASELRESDQRGDVHIYVSRVSGVHCFFLGILLKLGPWPLGVGDRGCGIAGTVAIGDRDSGGVYSWNSAEGLGQQARVLWFHRRRMLRLCELTWRE